MQRERGWSRGDLAKRLGFNETTISRKLSDSAVLSDEDIAKFARAFGLTYLDFRSRLSQFRVQQVPNVPHDRIPVINGASAGPTSMSFEWGTDSAQGFRDVERGSITDPHAFAVVVRGDSMEPGLHDGDVLIIRPADPTFGNLRVESGDVVFVRFTPDAARAEESCIGRVKFLPSGRVKIAKDNPKYQDITVKPEEIAQLGKAVEKRSVRL